MLTQRNRLLMLAAITLCPALCAAQATPVSAESQASVDQPQIIESLQTGDIACYLQLTDGRQLMADFALCENEQPPLGEPLLLRATEQQVAAASCEGDPECADSETVSLIVGWRRISATSERCAAGELLIFHCPTGRKQVALCQDHKGQLRYRFGADLGAAEKDMTRSPNDPAQVEGATQVYAGGGAAWLRLREGRHAYVLYSGIGRWGENGQPEAREGISVEREGRTIARIPCSSPAESLLGPDWFEAHGIHPADPDAFDLPI